MSNPLKIGLDIHGVIDTFPERFKNLASALKKDGAEVHIVTGLKRDQKVDELLHSAGIEFSHYFSIVEHLENSGVEVEWREGLPYADKHKWNSAKRDYCLAQNIDFMFDDSPIYKETFNDIATTYLHLINPERVIYQTRQC